MIDVNGVSLIYRKLSLQKQYRVKGNRTSKGVVTSPNDRSDLICKYLYPTITCDLDINLNTCAVTL